MTPAAWLQMLLQAISRSVYSCSTSPAASKPTTDCPPNRPRPTPQPLRTNFLQRRALRKLVEQHVRRVRQPLQPHAAQPLGGPADPKELLLQAGAQRSAAAVVDGGDIRRPVGHPPAQRQRGAAQRDAGFSAGQEVLQQAAVRQSGTCAWPIAKPRAPEPATQPPPQVRAQARPHLLM